MHEAILRDFFLGVTDAPRLQADLQGGVVRSGVTREHHIADMDTEFSVEQAHLVRLCDVVLAGELPPEALQQIGFCLIASDRFHWDADTPDGSVVAETLADWSCPEVNWPLVPENIRKWREGLALGSYLFEKDPGMAERSITEFDPDRDPYCSAVVSRAVDPRSTEAVELSSF